MKTFRPRITPGQVLIALTGIALLATLVIGEDRTAGGSMETAERPRMSTATGVANPNPADEKVAEPALELHRLMRETRESTSVDLFSSNAPPPPAVPVATVVNIPPVPVAPSAPPLPFTYLGRMIESGRTTVFVANRDEPLELERGETVQGVYRLEEVGESNATFVHLPTNTRQLLTIPSGN